MGSKKNILILGAGSLAQAVLSPWQRHKNAPSSFKFCLYTPTQTRAHDLAKLLDGDVLKNPHEVWDWVKINGPIHYVFLFFKPQQMPAGLDPWLDLFRLHKASMVSFLAAVDIQQLTAIAGINTPIVRVMSNTAAKIAAGVHLWACNSSYHGNEIQELLAVSGKVFAVSEGQLDKLTTVTACLPGLLFHLSSKLKLYAESFGLHSPQSDEMINEVLWGASLYQKLEGKKSEILRDEVTSKGGMTESALVFIEQNKIFESFIQALDIAFLHGQKIKKRE
jgi:pyrroline-5-carboxylate reductase